MDNFKMYFNDDVFHYYNNFNKTLKPTFRQLFK